MQILLALARAIDRVNIVVGKAASWMTLAAVLVSTANATVRKLFNISSNAWLELQWYLFSAVFLLAAGWTLLDNEHVKVDLFYQRFSRRTQLWVELVGNVICLMPFCLITIALSWPIVMSKLASGEVSNNTGGLLLWPVWMLVPIGFSLLAAQSLSEIIKRIAILRGDIPDDIAEANSAALAL